MPGLVSAAVLALLLTGCVSHEQRAADIAAELENLPGVISVSSNGNDRGIVNSAGQGVRVDVDPTIDPVDAAAIVEKWIEVGGSDDSSSGFTMSAESTLAPEVPLGDHGIYLEHAGLDEAQALAAASLWATLLPANDEVIVRLEGDDKWFSVTTSRAVDTPSITALAGELDGVVPPGLRDLHWTIGASLNRTDQLRGVTLSTNSGLPDAELLAFVDRLDPALTLASFGGGYQLSIADNAGSGFDRDPAYSIDVTLDPDDLRDVPSNQTFELIPNTSSWTSAQAFAGALRVDDDVELTLTLFNGRAFAELDTDSCERSVDPDNSPYGADLWAHWLRFGGMSADGSTATACA